MWVGEGCWMPWREIPFLMLLCSLVYNYEERVLDTMARDSVHDSTPDALLFSFYNYEEGLLGPNTSKEH